MPLKILVLKLNKTKIMNRRIHQMITNLMLLFLTRLSLLTIVVTEINAIQKKREPPKWKYIEQHKHSKPMHACRNV